MTSWTEGLPDDKATAAARWMLERFAANRNTLPEEADVRATAKAGIKRLHRWRDLRRCGGASDVHLALAIASLRKLLAARCAPAMRKGDAYIARQRASASKPRPRRTQNAELARLQRAINEARAEWAVYEDDPYPRREIVARIRRHMGIEHRQFVALLDRIGATQGTVTECVVCDAPLPGHGKTP